MPAAKMIRGDGCTRDLKRRNAEVVSGGQGRTRSREGRLPRARCACGQTQRGENTVEIVSLGDETSHRTLKATRIVMRQRVSMSWR